MNNSNKIGYGVLFLTLNNQYRVIIASYDFNKIIPTIKEICYRHIKHFCKPFLRRYNNWENYVVYKVHNYNPHIMSYKLLHTFPNSEASWEIIMEGGILNTNYANYKINNNNSIINELNNKCNLWKETIKHTKKYKSIKHKSKKELIDYYNSFNKRYRCMTNKKFNIKINKLTSKRKIKKMIRKCIYFELNNLVEYH